MSSDSLQNLQVSQNGELPKTAKRPRARWGASGPPTLEVVSRGAWGRKSGSIHFDSAGRRRVQRRTVAVGPATPRGKDASSRSFLQALGTICLIARSAFVGFVPASSMKGATSVPAHSPLAGAALFGQPRPAGPHGKRPPRWTFKRNASSGSWRQAW
jgi:hypothetical protein